MTIIRPLLGGLAVSVLGSVLLLAATHVPAYSFSSGVPPGFSGPEDVCNACHSGGQSDPNPPNTGTGSVTIDAPATYTPGETIAITVTVDNTTPPVVGSPRQGFQLSARVPDSGTPLEHIGSFDLGGSMSVQFAPAGAEPDTNYVTHTTANETSWSFSWVAPDEGESPPEVVFYVAGNASNSNFAPDAGDLIYTATHTLTRTTTANEPDALPLALELGAVYPNPSRGDAQATLTLAESGAVTAVLRDGRGRTVRLIEQSTRPAGAHTLQVNAAGLAAGLYFLTVTSAEGAQTRPLMLVR
ncbi:MAG: T9SS type A sorting domain-containing protein [Rhodothermaceae bacterium]|nr:T9SS type A sorting domain-containing protein [Rhodothermaceae bacterium]